VEVNSIKYHDWLSAATGMKISYEDLFKLGARIINLERALNTRFGIRRRHDTLPRRFMTQQLPSGPAKGETYSEEQLNKMLDEYYELRGWDKRTGLLQKKKLVELNMDDVANDLEARKLVVK
jgi:aldehyde:ferredoxin oxidoreductase